MDSTFIEVQPDWELVIREQSEKTRKTSALNSEAKSAESKLGEMKLAEASARFWVSSYAADEASNHGSVLVSPSDAEGNAPELITQGDFQVQHVDAYRLRVQCNVTKYSCDLLAPQTTFSPHPLNPPQRGVPDMKIFSVDVARDGKLGISGSEKGEAKLWDMGSGAILHSLEGHHGDVNVARFFPSGQVTLTAAADLRIKVWAVANGRCALTLTGHSRPVTEALFWGIGRNVLTSSLDGRLKLWDLSRADPVWTWSAGSIDGSGSQVGLLAASSSEAHSLTALGVESGQVLITDTRLAAPAALVAHAVIPAHAPTPVTAVLLPAAFNLASSAVVIAGDELGRLCAFDLRHLLRPIADPVIRASASARLQVAGSAARRGELEAAVLRLREARLGSVWVCGQDGGVSLWQGFGGTRVNSSGGDNADISIRRGGKVDFSSEYVNRDGSLDGKDSESDTWSELPKIVCELTGVDGLPVHICLEN
jgi:hypothetical protein